MFVTIDIEIADRILSSFCSIAIITWEDEKIIDEFYSFINPDCEIEEFFKERHGLKNEDLINSPTLPELWIDIYNRLENKTVFCYDANSVISTLLSRASVDQLNLPNMSYASVKSICKKTWKDLDNYSLPYMTEKLNITKIHNNAYEDAKSIGKLIFKASEELMLESTYDMFREIGFSGGYVVNNKKIPYRAIKSKEKNCYITKR